MTDVFISYKREEKAFAERIASALTKRGYDVWWDAEILPGEEYRQRTLAVLRACKAAIVMWSPLSAASSWVQDEAQVAKNRGVLVPVLIAPLDDFPLGFGQLHTHTLIGWDGAAEHDLFKPVLAAIERLAGRAAPAGETKRKPRKREAGNEAEVAFWRGIQDSRNRADFETYLARYPEGMFADLARDRLARFAAAPVPLAGLQLPKLDGVRGLFTRAGGAAPRLRRSEIAFLAAVALIAPFLLWPIVNIVIGAESAFWGPDFQNLFDVSMPINLYWAVPVLTVGGLLYRRLEAWIATASASWAVLALRIATGAVLAIAFVFGIGDQRYEDDGATAHFALWTASVWTAAIFADRVAPRLRAAFAAN